MKKLSVLLFLLLLCGCSNNNEVKDIYNKAFENTFTKDYATYSLTKEVNGTQEVVVYSEYFFSDDTVDSLSYTLYYKDETLNNGKITCIIGDQYLMYSCQSTEDKIVHDGNYTGSTATKVNICDSKSFEIDTKQSKKTDTGLLIYYEVSGIYMIDEVTIEDGKIVKEEYKGYKEESHETLTYYNYCTFKDVNGPQEEEQDFARSFRGQTIKEVETYVNEQK